MSGQEGTGSDDGFRNAYRKSESDAGQLIGPIPYYANLATNMFKDTSNMPCPSYSKANADAPMSSGVCNPQGAPFLKTSPDVIGYSSSKGLIDKGTPYNVFAGGGNAFEGGGSMDDDETPFQIPYSAQSLVQLSGILPYEEVNFKGYADENKDQHLFMPEQKVVDSLPLWKGVGGWWNRTFRSKEGYDKVNKELLLRQLERLQL